MANYDVANPILTYITKCKIICAYTGFDIFYRADLGTNIHCIKHL